MTLFHRSAAAPWGHVASIIKKSPTGDSLFLVPLPQLLASGPFRSSPLTVYILSTFHHRDPRAMNAPAELKGTGHTQLSSSRHFICKPTLQTPSHTYLTTFTHFTQPYNLHNKPNHILHLELFLELSFVNSSNSLYIPFGIIPCLLLLLLYINFDARTSSSSSSLQKLSPSIHCCLKYGLFFYKT